MKRDFRRMWKVCDVESLFTSILVKETNDIFKEIYKNKSIKSMCKLLFHQLLEKLTQKYAFTVNHKLEKLRFAIWCSNFCYRAQYSHKQNGKRIWSSVQALFEPSVETL